ALLQENLDLPDVHVCEVWPGGVNTPVYQQSGNYAGRAGRPPPPVVSADRVAAAVERVADRPVPRTMVGLANPVMIVGFGAFPWVFDRLVVPLMSRIGIGREPAPPGPGNVLAPRPRLNATDGPWRGPLGLRRRKNDGGKP
nr:short-chain dehydrogenase [Geodermatophilaceae bacterium]